MIVFYHVAPSLYHSNQRLKRPYQIDTYLHIGGFICISKIGKNIGKIQKGYPKD